MASTHPALIVKITHGTEIRRFTTAASALTWETLSARATGGFELAHKNFKLTYVDEENDRITISSDEELADAVSLALQAVPAVLRLAVHGDVTMKKAKRAANAEDKTDKADVRDASNNTAGAVAPDAPPEIATFVETIAKQLPALIGQLPATVREMIPNAELDLAATIAANEAAEAAKKGLCGPDPFVRPHPESAPEGVHPGITCDKSGQCPIMGNRYHLVGHNYDVCEAEYEKLDAKEKANFMCIPPPSKAGGGCGGMAKVGLHPGVECDRSGMCPIIGTRFKLKGHNYDLCQAEFDKLPATEKLLYEAFPPPTMGVHPAATAAAAAGGAWHPRWWPRRCGGPHGGPPPGMGFGHQNKDGQGCGPKLAARFVRDVTIFDGTQMTPGTAFTKIWRLKNVGEVPWPPGTRILFVGGDQMTKEMSVPLGRDLPVMPGEEVDAAVEMHAPTELGRYLGYWRLTGPMMRRKFGQRIWCHVQVISDATPEMPTDEAAIASTYAEIATEIAKKKSDLLAANEPDQPEEEGEPTPAAAATATAATTTPKQDQKKDETRDEKKQADDVDGKAPAAAPLVLPTVLPTAVAPTPAEADGTKDGTASDDGVLVASDEEGLAVDTADAEPATPAKKTATDPGPSGAENGGAEMPDEMPDEMPAEFGTASLLRAMGFTDEALIQTAITKHGDDAEACARDLVAATEWDSLLDDLAEMGFGNRELNKTLMLKNAGNIKRTVKDLVEA